MNNNLPGIGDNTNAPNYFETESERLRSEYDYLRNTVEAHLAEAKPIVKIDDQAGKDVVTALMKTMRETWKRIEGVHEAEKAPHLERGRATDGFFFGLMEKLGRRSKTGPKGEGERLNDLLTDYDLRVLAAEQERRRKAAEEAARIARIAEEARLKAEREEAERRLAAERARLEETKAAKGKAAEEAAKAASEARVEETVAANRAEETYIETLAAPKDIMRQRSDAGVTSGMGTEKFVEITDLKALDLEALRPYLMKADLEKAVRKYADSVSFSDDESVQIAGARFGKRAKSRVY